MVLIKLRQSKAMNAIAAQDPDAAERFIAALYMAGSQLLVVSGNYPVPELLKERIQRREFRDVYMDLQGSAAPETRVFVHDMSADGLRQHPGAREAFDVVYDADGRSTIFGGDGPAGMSDTAYRSPFAERDQRYARMLSVPVPALRLHT